MFDQINQYLIEYPIIRFLILPSLFALLCAKPIFVFLTEWAGETADRRKEKSEHREYQRKQQELEMAEEKEYQKQIILLAQEEKQTEYQKLRSEIEAMPKYENWRQEIFSKYGRICEVCGSTDQVEIHHRQSFYSIIMKNKITNVMQAFECNALWDVNNGSVVCKDHHDQTASSIYRQQKLA